MIRNFVIGSLIIAALLFGACETQAQILSYWRFDETSGPTAFDSQGTVHGTLQGGAAFAPGQGILGGAVTLDPATNSLVNMANNYSFIGSPFSIVAWVRMANGDTLRGLPVAKHRSTISQGYFLAVNDVADGLGASAVNKAHFWAGNSNNSFTPASAITINDGAWHQVVGVFNSPSNLKELYVDGVFQTSATHGPVAGNTASFLIGGVDVGGVPTGDYRGFVDNVQVYGNALTAAQVNFLFNVIVPEPGSMILGGVGFAVAGIGGWRRRRAGKAAQ